MAVWHDIYHDLTACIAVGGDRYFQLELSVMSAEFRRSGYDAAYPAHCSRRPRA